MVYAETKQMKSRKMSCIIMYQGPGKCANNHTKIFFDDEYFTQQTFISHLYTILMILGTVTTQLLDSECIATVVNSNCVVTVLPAVLVVN